MMNKRFPALALLSLACAALASASEARRLSSAVKSLGADESVRAVAAVAPADLQASMPITFTLAMRNIDELRDRVARGENLVNGKLTQAEMESLYLPLASDYQATRDWLAQAGFTLDGTDVFHTSVSVHGPVALVQKVLSVEFARVTTAEGSFVSAMGAPLLPAGLPASVTAVSGLQPHHRAHPHTHRLKPSAVTVSGGLYLSPTDLKNAYGALASVTGSGQTISIIMDSTVLDSDLTTFWSTAGIATRTPANVTTIPINGGPPAQLDPDSQDEAALDVSYASSVATGSLIRLYAVNSLTTPNISAALTAIIADHANLPTMNILSMSFGGREIDLAPSEVTTLTQEFLQLSALGVTIVASSGDSGSNPDPVVNLSYNASNPLTPEYPASDPSVTGVGGTNLSFNSNLLYSSEAAWSEIPAKPVATTGYAATGGGVSTLFPHQSWQTDGKSVLGQYTTQRCVPDVAAISVGTYLNQEIPVFIIVNGTPQGEVGTSLAAPVWAAFVAMINQNRSLANVPMGAIGFMNPLLYKYSSAGMFNDVTTGSNGAYSAAVGYDLTTGLGSPILGTMLPILAGTLPVISVQPTSEVVEETQTALFALTATGNPAPTFQWQRKAAGTSTWVNLADAGPNYRGTQTNSLYVFLTTKAMDQDQFQCVVTNAIGSVTSTPVILSSVPYVNLFPTTTASGGGGGAVSPWFLAALALLAGARSWGKRRRLAV